MNPETTTTATPAPMKERNFRAVINMFGDSIALQEKIEGDDDIQSIATIPIPAVTPAIDELVKKEHGCLFYTAEVKIDGEDYRLHYDYAKGKKAVYLFVDGEAVPMKTIEIETIPKLFIEYQDNDSEDWKSTPTSDKLIELVEEHGEIDVRLAQKNGENVLELSGWGADSKVRVHERGLRVLFGQMLDMIRG